MSETAPKLTAELIVDSAVLRYPVISPDGAWVAYVVTRMGLSERPLGEPWRPASRGGREADLPGSSGWDGPGPHRHDQLSPVSFAARIRTRC